MNILFDNKILGANITALNASQNYSVENLKSPFLHLKYQASSTSDIITILFDEVTKVDSFYFGYTNMTEMVVRFYDELDTLLESIIFDGNGSVAHYYGFPPTNLYGYDDQYYGYFDRQSGTRIVDVVSWYLSRILDVKKIEIEITGPDGVYLGGVAAGLKESVNLPLATWTEDFKDLSIVSTSESGQTLQEFVRPARALKFDIPVNTRAEVNKVLETYLQYGVGHHLWLDPFEKNHDFMQPLYCTLSSVIQAKKNGYNYSYNLEVIEAR